MRCNCRRHQREQTSKPFPNYSRLHRFGTHLLAIALSWNVHKKSRSKLRGWTEFLWWASRDLPGRKTYKHIQTKFRNVTKIDQIKSTLLWFRWNRKPTKTWSLWHLGPKTPSQIPCETSVPCVANMFLPPLDYEPKLGLQKCTMDNFPPKKPSKSKDVERPSTSCGDLDVLHGIKKCSIRTKFQLVHDILQDSAPRKFKMSWHPHQTESKSKSQKWHEKSATSATGPQHLRALSHRCRNDTCGEFGCCLTSWAFRLSAVWLMKQIRIKTTPTVRNLQISHTNQGWKASKTRIDKVSFADVAWCCKMNSQLGHCYCNSHRPQKPSRCCGSSSLAGSKLIKVRGRFNLRIVFEKFMWQTSPKAWNWHGSPPNVEKCEQKEHQKKNTLEPSSIESHHKMLSMRRKCCCGTPLEAAACRYNRWSCNAAEAFSSKLSMIILSAIIVTIISRIVKTW